MYTDNRDLTLSLELSEMAAWSDFYKAGSAQSTSECGLMARRIRDARELGCKMPVVETAEDTPQKGAPSFRNMLRLGFQVAYVRPNFILSNGAA